MNCSRGAQGNGQRRALRRTYRAAPQGQLEVLTTLYTLDHVLEYMVRKVDAESLWWYRISRGGRALKNEAGFRNLE